MSADRRTSPGGADVLVLDASVRQALVVVRELGRAGLRVAAADPHRGAPAFASRWCEHHRLVPDFADDPDAFVDATLALCEAWGVRVVIPCHDGAIAALRPRRERFDGVAALALANERALTVAVDKHLTLEAASALGIPVPRGAMVTSVDEVAAIVAEVGLPVVVKPSQSWVGEGASQPRLGATLARTVEEAVEAVGDITGTGTEAAVQGFLPGAREAISFVYSDGRFLARFAQRADRMLPAVGGSSILRESIPLPPDTTAHAERLVDGLGLDGYCEVEFRRDAAGVPVLMEINPRLSASVEIAVRAGVPFPQLIYDLAAGEPVTPVDGYRSGARMRWLAGDALWVAQALTQPGGHPDLPSRPGAVAAFFASFLRRSGYDYVDRGDPRPALSAFVSGARRGPAKLLRFVRRRRAARDGSRAAG